MRKLSITILLLTYVFIQLVTFSWNFYKPVIHAICYNQLRLRSCTKGENEFVIKTDPASYQKALQDKYEILWEGELYDIKSIAANGNEITLVVQKDITETRWVDACNKIQQHINNSKPTQSPTDVRFSIWMFKLYVPSETVASDIANSSATSQKSLYLSAFNTVFYSDGPCKPPDTVS